jgi:thiamine monophosphate synthase
MHVRDGRELARQFDRLLMINGTQGIAEARQSAVIHCLADALAVRMLRRYREQKARIEVDERREA